MPASHSPLPDILDFLLTLYMSRAGEMKRDEVREQARLHWNALGNYLKSIATEDLERLDPPVPEERRVARGHRAGNHRSVRERFTPRRQAIA